MGSVFPWKWIYLPAIVLRVDVRAAAHQQLHEDGVPVLRRYVNAAISVARVLEIREIGVIHHLVHLDVQPNTSSRCGST